MSMHACVCMYMWGTEGVLRNVEESVHETVEVGLGQLWADGKLGTQGRAGWYSSVSLRQSQTPRQAHGHRVSVGEATLVSRKPQR